MYIVAIAWLYVTVLMAATESSLLAGITTFLLYGLLPCSIVMYLLGAPGRYRAIKAREAAEREALSGADAPSAPAETAHPEKTPEPDKPNSRQNGA